MITPGAPSTESDEALMRRVSVGDDQAFEAIYDRYHVRAYSLARRITGQPGGAEEATQDAFLSLWRQASTYNPKLGTLSNWLFALVRYRSIDWLRRSKSRNRNQDLREDAANDIEARERTDEQVIALDGDLRARELVAALPPEQREVIHLSYFAGYTQVEIAEALGTPLGTVKGRARLGLLKLLGKVEGESQVVPTA